MYCKRCGNLLDDTDERCEICGNLIAREDNSVEPVEEVIYNPPFQEEEGSESSVELIREPEFQRITESKPKFTLAELGSEENQEKHDSEFVWNVHDFPKSKKTEEIVFNWGSDLETGGNSNLLSQEHLEQLLFKDVRNDSKSMDSGMEKFFTFNKKNEEFQELLDKEYDRLRKHKVGDFEPETQLESESQTESLHQAESTVESVSQMKQPAPQTAQTAPLREQVVPQTEQAAPQPEQAAPQTKKMETAAPKASHIDEMSHARAEFFKDAVPTAESASGLVAETASGAMPETVSAQAAESASETAEKTAESTSESVIKAAASTSESVIKTVAPTLQSMESAAGSDAELKEEKTPDKQGKVGCFLKGLLIIISIILIIEIAILGIRHFAPGSSADRQIYKVQTILVDHVKDLFSDKDAKKEQKKPEQQKPTEEEKATEVSKPSDSIEQIPDAAPEADKNALVSSQLHQNKNIAVVRANTELTYQLGKDYGITDINQSKPIVNNIWKTPKEGETGDTVYYDQSVVGTIIAFDSQWIDYVNGGSKSVLDLLKKDSKAYKNAVGFSKIGKIKESFQLLEIGEIRQGKDGFYIWVHEEIQIAENGKTTDKKYNWIYYLEPIDGNMKIVGYYKF